jgi:AhpD family alkylhydroperoxidase
MWGGYGSGSARTGGCLRERAFAGCVGQGYSEGKTEVSMQERFQYAKAYPDAYKAMLALTQAVERTGLAPQLIDLVNYRISQLNGCAFCLDMHSKDLRARGETEQRLYMMSAWREAPHLYSSRERAAFAWAEGSDSA